MNLTEQGIQTVKDSVDRADAARSALKAQGVDLTDIYWTIGAHDLVYRAGTGRRDRIGRAARARRAGKPAHDDAARIHGGRVPGDPQQGRRDGRIRRRAQCPAPPTVVLVERELEPTAERRDGMLAPTGARTSRSPIFCAAPARTQRTSTSAQSQKAPVDGLRGRARSDSQLLSQSAAQRVVDEQRFCGVAARRERLHEQAVASLAQWRKLDQRSPRTECRVEFARAQSESGGRHAFERAQPNLVEAPALLARSMGLLAGKKDRLAVRRDPGRRPRGREFAAPDRSSARWIASNAASTSTNAPSGRTRSSVERPVRAVAPTTRRSFEMRAASEASRLPGRRPPERLRELRPRTAASGWRRDTQTPAGPGARGVRARHAARQCGRPGARRAGSWWRGSPSLAKLTETPRRHNCSLAHRIATNGGRPWRAS